MTISSLQFSTIKGPVPVAESNKQNPAVTRLGVQGEAPLTGMKGLGSTGGLREMKFRAPAIKINMPKISMPNMSGFRGGSMSGGIAGGFGGGGGDFGRLL